MHDLVLAAVRWDPELRGIAVVAVSVLILCGSVYLLLATNLGVRQGFLVAAAGLAGWMVLMGVVWWIYGIGLKGRAAAWEVEEIVTGDVSFSSVEDVQTFPDGWRELPAGDADAAEAEATATAALISEENPDAPFTSASEFIRVGAFAAGGDTKWLGLKHEPHYAITQVQQVVEQEAEPGQAPPQPVADKGEPVVTVIMVRDLGSLRVPAAAMTISSLILFGLLAHVLHRRDKELMAAAAADG